MWTRAILAGLVVLILLDFCDLNIPGVDGQDTKFSFPKGFLGQDRGNFSGVGDVSNTDTYYDMNFVEQNQRGDSGPSCGRVVYKDTVRMVDISVATRTAASFKTAFSFSFRSNPNPEGECGDGMVFGFYKSQNIGDVELSRAGGSFCVFNRADLNGSERIFALEIDSYYNVNTSHLVPYSDYSDSHIAVYTGTKNLTACPLVGGSYRCDNQYNLCSNSQFFGSSQGNESRCSFFCGDMATTYTVWIDYDSARELLEVRFRNGSLSAVQKPVDTILTLPNFRLGEFLDQESVYVGFTASTGVRREVHTIQGWEFESSGLPNPNSPAPLPEPLPPPLPPPLPAPSNGAKSKPVALIAGISSAVAAAIGVGLLCFCLIRNYKQSSKQLISTTLEAAESSRAYTYRELSRATKNFSTGQLLSSGAFGDVYRGTLSSGAVVAIKRIKENKEQGEESFLAEATSLRQIRHRNLLQLRGWSHTREGLFLVCDYMCNGSLDKWIYRRSFDGKVSSPLSWDVRVSILAGVAAGLEYLHEGWVQCVLHRDIKSSNVMLDAEFNPCLGDFGLARLIDHNKLQRTTLLAGTLGYMAPEMMHTGRATKETDVYAFGVMVLEVACGRRPLDVQATCETDYVLLDSVWRAHEAGDISKMADVETSRDVEIVGDEDVAMAMVVVPDLGDESEVKTTVANLLHLGLLCCLPDPSERPSMRTVNRWLQSAQGGAMDPLPPLPKTKPHHGQSSPLPFSSEGTTSSSLSQSSGYSRLQRTPSDTD